MLTLSTALVAFALSGCIDSTTMVILNKDGSGNIIETTYMSAQAAGMMGGMGGMMGGMGGGDANANANPMMDKEKAEAKAATLGEGVSFVSMKPVSKKDGSKGARTVYAFTDINKIAVTTKGGIDDKSPQKAEKKEEEPPIVFSYSKGKLVVTLPQEKATESSDAEATVPAPDPQEAAMQAQMMQGMLPMLKGMRMRVVLKMAEEIKKTDATFVSPSKETGKDHYVTLFDFNMDKLIAAPDGMTKFTALQNGGGDHAETVELLKGVPGIKVEPKSTVTIEF